MSVQEITFVKTVAYTDLSPTHRRRHASRLCSMSSQKAYTNTGAIATLITTPCCWLQYTCKRPTRDRS